MADDPEFRPFGIGSRLGTCCFFQFSQCPTPGELRQKPITGRIVPQFRLFWILLSLSTREVHLGVFSVKYLRANGSLANTSPQPLLDSLELEHFDNYAGYFDHSFKFKETDLDLANGARGVITGIVLHPDEPPVGRQSGGQAEAHASIYFGQKLGPVYVDIARPLGTSLNLFNRYVALSRSAGRGFQTVHAPELLQEDDLQERLDRIMKDWYHRTPDSQSLEDKTSAITAFRRRLDQPVTYTNSLSRCLNRPRQSQTELDPGWSMSLRNAVNTLRIDIWR
ncbi:hypothetical protein C8J56DRAFT_898829 [Mycena floridula]|nr:hypothetical protein C8J56DRAFT_898829 [Mycena floridula]